jgi:hypothetical protein
VTVTAAAAGMQAAQQPQRTCSKPHVIFQTTLAVQAYTSLVVTVTNLCQYRPPVHLATTRYLGLCLKFWLVLYLALADEAALPV